MKSAERSGAIYSGVHRGEADTRKSVSREATWGIESIAAMSIKEDGHDEAASGATEHAPMPDGPSRRIDAGSRSSGTGAARRWRRFARSSRGHPDVVEEWKWRGVPVWYRDGMICTGETYRNHVKLTFARSAELDDPSGCSTPGSKAASGAPSTSTRAMRSAGMP